jgi:hypothetical protein
VFLLYRWPADTPWASAAPAQLQTLPWRCVMEPVYVSIPLGFDRGRALHRSPETATACAVYNVSVETAEQRVSLMNSINQAVGATPLLCREDFSRKPCSSLMWLPLEDAIQQVPGRDVELQDLVDAGRHSLLRALESMEEEMAPHLNSGTAKRRSKADALQAAEDVARRRQMPFFDARRRIIIAGGDAEWILRQLNYVEKLEELSESEEAYVYDLAMGEIERVIPPQPSPIIPDDYIEIAVRRLEVLCRIDPDKARFSAACSSASVSARTTHASALRSGQAVSRSWNSPRTTFAVLTILRSRSWRARRTSGTRSMRGSPRGSRTTTRA